MAAAPSNTDAEYDVVVIGSGVGGLLNRKFVGASASLICESRNFARPVSFGSKPTFSAKL